MAKLEEMKAQSRNICDQVMLEFDIESYITMHSRPVDRVHLVQSMIHELIKKLPEGFSIKLYPMGADFENV